MITDFQIFGIEETSDIDIIKKAYRKRVKETHPDNASEESLVRNHFLFIQINQAYTRLTRNKGLSQFKDKGIRPEDIEGKTITRHKDPAYVFYRTAMRYYMQIHPSQWNKRRNLFDSNKLPMNQEERDERRRIVFDLIKLFPKAYYYFSIVVHEYPSSPWVDDSLEKMELIEGRTKKYGKILESFYSWPSVAKEKAKRLEDIIKRTNAIVENEGSLKWPE